MTRGVVKITSNGWPFLIDKEDEHLLVGRNWHADFKRKDRTKYYIRASDGTGDKLHRIILDAPRGVPVDHINGLGYDNRRCNLRLVTVNENAKNRRKQKQKTGKILSSSYKGVTRTSGGKWVARIRANNKLYHLGTYLSDIEAAIVYDEHVDIYHGEFGAKNFVNGLPQIERQGKTSKFKRPEDYSMTRTAIYGRKRHQARKEKLAQGAQ